MRKLNALGKMVVSMEPSTMKYNSIFICIGTARKRANSIERYTLTKDFLCGTNEDEPRYDILSAVIINLGSEQDTGSMDQDLITVLTVLLDEGLGAEEKITRLDVRDRYQETEYHFHRPFLSHR